MSLKSTRDSDHPVTGPSDHQVRLAPLTARSDIILVRMYEDFHVTGRWTSQKLHCLYQALIVAIVIRHADAAHIKFVVNGHPVWIAMPNPARVEYQKQTGRVITGTGHPGII